jgi:hypothetical protein
MTVDIRLGLPPGYAELPLTGVAHAIAAAGAMIDDLGSVGTRVAANRVFPMGRLLLESLAARGTRFCGIGRHACSDGGVVVSWLTVTVVDIDDAQAPRLVLKSLLDAKRDAGENGEIVVRDIGGRPMLLHERIRRLPAPTNDEADGDETTPVFQLEAVVTDDDGTALAIVELATRSTEYGPEYRGMVIDVARSAEFRRPPEEVELIL